MNGSTIWDKWACWAKSPAIILLFNAATPQFTIVTSIMLSLARRLRSGSPCLRSAAQQLRWARTDGGSSRRRSRTGSLVTRKPEEKTQWWIVDGEMHEVGENVPPRQRFVIPRDNIPNKRRKQLREQFMRRTRLVLKENEHEPWCKKYMELYQELRENWERLYWDEGYSKKIAQDHANYDSPEEDDDDFSPYRNRPSNGEPRKDWNFVGKQGDDTLEKVSRIRDKFEYDREKRMQEKAFAPMRGEAASSLHESNPKNQPLDVEKYFSLSE